MTGQARAEKVVSLKKSIKSQREIFTKHKHQNEAAVRANFKICHVLAKASFTDSEFVKTCLEKAVQELCPQNQQLFNSISLSANTVASRTTGYRRWHLSQFQDAWAKFEWYSIDLGKSTDVFDSVLFIRGMNRDLEVIEELADVYSMETNVTGIQIFSKVNDTIAKLKLDFKKLKGITTDGGKNMSGHKTGLVGLVCNAVQNAGGEKPLIFHCIVHQQSLYG